VRSNLVEDSDMNNSITNKTAIVYFDPRLKFCTERFSSCITSHSFSAGCELQIRKASGVGRITSRSGQKAFIPGWSEQWWKFYFTNSKL